MGQLTAALGAVLVLVTWLTVIRTVYAPGQRSTLAARCTVLLVGSVTFRIGRLLRDCARERLLELCAPVSLLLMGAVWVGASTAGFALLAEGIDGSFFGLLFPAGAAAGDRVLALAALVSCGLVLASFGAHVARVVAAGERRDHPLVRLGARVTETANAEFMLVDYLRTGSRDRLDSQFARWSAWLADLDASHQSYPALPYLRSGGSLSWADAALVVLDCAAIVQAIAPGWAPPNTGPLLAVGRCSLPRLAGQLGQQRSRSPVSFHGREARDFGATFQTVVEAGLPSERDRASAERTFLDIRIAYAPYAVSIVECLMLAGRTRLIRRAGIKITCITSSSR